MEDNREHVMAKVSLPSFEEALKAGQSFVRVSVRARDAQYRFLALTYLAQVEAQRRPRLFKTMVESRLGRSASNPEEKRPFLLILHALIGIEDDAPRNALPQFSKLTSALEVIDNAFQGVKPVPKVDDIIDFIQQAGGVGGLYDLSRVGASDGTVSPQTDTQNVVNLKPNEIHLPMLSARVTKVGRGYRLRMTEFQPGEYIVRIRVGRGGFVEAILDESISDEDAA
jgi:hypothetical protein